MTKLEAPSIAPSKDEIVNPFGEFIIDRWRKLGLHQAEFCRLVESPAGWVQQIRQGSKSAPLYRMDQWADALALRGDQRQLLFDLAAITHLPHEARARFVALVEAAHAKHRNIA